jgi:uncharacterized Zn finger protein (UPF0148 family)
MSFAFTEMIRNDNGDFSAHAWPGGYPLFYLMADGETMCAKCINKEVKLVVDATVNGDDKQWEIVGSDVNWEDPALFCAHCNQRIESAYAEDEATDSLETYLEDYANPSEEQDAAKA